MKQFLFLLLILPAITLGQKKYDNTIIVPAVSIDSIKDALFQRGLSLTGTDTVYLSTSSKELRQSSVAIKLMIKRTDTLTYIQGMIKPTVSTALWGVKSENEFERLSYVPQPGPQRNAWNEMEYVAKILGSVIRYQRL